MIRDMQNVCEQPRKHLFRRCGREMVRNQREIVTGEQFPAIEETDPAGQAQVSIGYGSGRPSRLILPQVPGGAATTGLPPCPGLRGEPCRDYQPSANGAG